MSGMDLVRAVVVNPAVPTVTLGGSTTAYPALAIAGQSLSAADVGFAIVRPGMTPIFLKTV